MWPRRRTQGQPRIVYHRPRWPRRRRGVGDWLRLIGGVGLLVMLLGYILWLFVFAPGAHTVIWLPLVMR